MAFEVEQAVCSCGHEPALHDANGCAAFLGAFPETVTFKRYCPCERPREGALPVPFPTVTAAEAIVADVRVRERPGMAIAVCEEPPALELGSCADDVIVRVKRRLRSVVPLSPVRSVQLLRIVREDTGETRFETLR